VFTFFVVRVGVTTSAQQKILIAGWRSISRPSTFDSPVWPTVGAYSGGGLTLDQLEWAKRQDVTIVGVISRGRTDSAQWLDEIASRRRSATLRQ